MGFFEPLLVIILPLAVIAYISYLIQRASHSPKTPNQDYLRKMQQSSTKNFVAPADSSRNVKLYMEYHNRLSQILAKSKIAKNVQFELIPLLFSVSSLSLQNDDDKSRSFLNDLLPVVMKYCPDRSQRNAFYQRIDFYSDIAYSGALRGEWCVSDIPAELSSSPLNRMLVAFADIITNPDCASNYSNAPIKLSGIYEKAKFTDLFSSNVVPTIMEYCVSLVGDTDYTFVK